MLPWETASPAATTPAARGAPAAAATLRDDDNATSAAVALVEAGVVAGVNSCSGRWCHVSIGAYRGYIEQKRLWGVYQGERFR